MKKMFAIVLCAIMLFASLPLTAFATTEEFYPTVVVPGYSSSHLFTTDADGTERRIWGSIGGMNIGDVVMDNIGTILKGVGHLGVGDTEYLAKILADGVLGMVGDLMCDRNGEPIVETHTYPNDPALTNYKYLRENLNSMHAAETEIMSDVAKKYGDNGYENLFSFQCDFRLNIVDNVEVLRKYIDDVLEYTGAEKVNIYAVSYGGQLSAAYLNMYGYLGKVHNAVLTVPAIGGAALAYDILSETVKFDESTLVYFLENTFMLEEDYHWLTEADYLEFIDDLINGIVNLGVHDLLGYWGSIWDFVPAEYYEELKEQFLDEEESANLIAKSDYFHYEILPYMTQRLSECVDNGTNIYIVAGCDIPSVTGLYEQSDGIILLSGSTGAESAPFDMRYSDGFTGAKTVCDSEEHNHVSPSMNIDASTCFLPEQTWFVSGLFHGMTWKDEYTQDLCLMLLFSDECVSVHTYKEFPQFKYSTNVCYSVSAQFDSSKDGYWSADDKYLIVKNLSEEYDMKLLGINCYGIAAQFEVPLCTVLSPGEEIAIPFTAELPNSSMVTADIEVNYYLCSSVTPRGVRSLTFTIDNGEVAEYDSASPYTNAKHDTDFDKAFSCEFIKEFFNKTGLYNYIKMIFNMFVSFFR